MADEPVATVHTGDYGPLILAVSWALASIALILLGGRLYTGVAITRRLKADFWIALFTFAITIIAQVTLTISVNFGIGKPISTLDKDSVVDALEYVWICQIMFVAAMAFGKVAIVAFLLQIRGPHEPRPWVLYIIAVSNVIVNGITILFILLQCDPFRKLFDDRIEGKCDGHKRNQYFAFFQGSWSSISDMVLALYPIYICWKLQVQMHVKVGLCVLMGLGIIASVCSAVRTSELESLAHTDDITYFLSPLLIWTATETWIILIVGCVPPIRPLFLHLFHSVAAKVTTSSSRNRTYARSQFSKHGTAIPSERSINLPEIANGYSGTRNQVYLGNGVGSGYGQGGKKLGNGAGARGGVRDSSTDVDRGWLNQHANDDKVVVTTKIDVNYGSESSSGLFDQRNYPPDREEMQYLRKEKDTEHSRNNSFGARTFFRDNDDNV